MYDLSPERFSEAREKISPYILRTPYLPFDFLSRMADKQLWLKCESLQKTGSFKMRGASHCVLQNMTQAKRAGVIAASAGNHAQAVAAICSHLGIKATIVMPTYTPPIKVQNTERWGAQVVLHGSMYDEAYEKAELLAKEKGHVFIHAFRDQHIITGQGSAGLELLEEPEFKKVQAVVIPVGGGGFAAGVASVLKHARPDLKIYGVTAQLAPTFYESFQAKKVVSKPTKLTLAEGVAMKKTDQEMLELLQSRIDKMLSIDEKTIALAISLLSEHGKLVVEGSGALPVAAILQKQIPEKNICLMITGGNIDIPALTHVLHRGMVEQGRMVRLIITISDRPGGLNAVTQILAEQGANILQVFHQRSTLKADIGETEIEVDLETRGPEHTNEICKSLTDRNFRVNCVS